MKKSGFRIVPQDEFKDSILIEKYMTGFNNMEFSFHCLYLDIDDLPSLTKLLQRFMNDPSDSTIKTQEEAIIKTKEAYLEQRKKLIIEEQYEAVILLDKAFKHLK